MIRYLPAIARVLLGLIFFVFGLEGFLHFMPQPTTPMPEGVMSFMGAMMKTGYLFYLLKGTEVIVGALLLSNRFVPLALALIAPIVINIFAFLAFLMPGQVGMGVVLGILEIYLAFAYRKSFQPMLAMRATPN